MRTIGIDVSHWEGVIAWGVIKQYIGWAYYKCTDGLSYVDDTFVRNRLGCVQNNIPSAPYHWWYPDINQEQQARHFTSTAPGFKTYIVDVETPARQPMSAWAYWQALKAFIGWVVKLTDGRVAIYTNPNFWEEHFGIYNNEATRQPLIIAHYTYKGQPLLPRPFILWEGWQFNTHFYYPGCNTELDADWYNGTQDEVKQHYGLVGG